MAQLPAAPPKLIIQAHYAGVPAQNQMVQQLPYEYAPVPYYGAKGAPYVRQFTRDNDVSVEFDAYGFSVKDYQTGQLLLCCDSTGDLYPVTQQPSSQTRVVLLSFSSTTWHRCLGKHVKLPFYNSESSVDSVFKIIHWNIWTSPIPSESGIKYYAIFLDHFSHFVWVYPLHKKSDLFDNFVAFHAYVNKQFNVDIKALQCDHGGESAKMAYNFGFLALVFRNKMANPSRSASCLFLSQSKFAEQILERAHMQNCNPCRTPVDTRFKLGFGCVTLSATPTINYSIAGALQSCKKSELRQLSRSSAEAEYPGVANVVVETAWIRNLLCDLHTPLFTATLVYYNNFSVVYMSANPVQHQRTKHIEIDIHFVRDFVASGQVRVLHVPSRFQYADIFTKGLPTTLFLEFRSRTFEDLFQLSLILIDISNCHEVSFLIDCLCDKYH
ncbi:ribonuclease H-like domain-containing protein [Tanacetum coccineum]